MHVPDPDHLYKDLGLQQNLFQEIGQKCQTDKVAKVDGHAGHQYHIPYERALRPRRLEALKILEIGLGCSGHFTGAGRSVCLWKEYMPNAQIYVLEFDSACAMKFTDQVTQMFIGDQSNADMLKQVVDQAGPFDVVVSQVA